MIAEVVDVRNIEDLKRLETISRDQFGNVHILCNNAGVGGGGPVADPDDIEAWRWTININLWGVIYGCKVFLPAMIEHGEPCHVINTASMAGLHAPAGMGSYNVSKFEVVALSETLTREMQQAGTEVNVSVLCPAFVKTQIAESRRNMPPELVSSLAPRDPDVKSFASDLVSNGISPEIVADAVLGAAKNNKFWILTHEETKPGVIAKAQEIAAGVNPAPYSDLI